MYSLVITIITLVVSVSGSSTDVHQIEIDDFQSKGLCKAAGQEWLDLNKKYPIETSSAICMKKSESI